MRVQASKSGLVHARAAGRMRPSRSTSRHIRDDQAPHRRSRVSRFTRCQSWASRRWPSTDTWGGPTIGWQEHLAQAERREQGGGAGTGHGRRGSGPHDGSRAYHRSPRRRSRGSRTLRPSWVTRRLRRQETSSRTGSVSRLAVVALGCSNHSSSPAAARCSRSTSRSTLGIVGGERLGPRSRAAGHGPARSHLPARA